MWALRILTGPQAGQIFELKMGRNVIGRASHCDIKLASPGVSKEHSEVMVYKEKIVITDLRSSNGTYLNGIKTQTGLMRLGDKLGIHDVIADVIPAPEVKAVSSPRVSASPPMAAPPPRAHVYYDGGAAAQIQQPVMMGVPGPESAPAPAYQPTGIKGLLLKGEEYLEKVALPGVYKLAQFFEFKMVLLGFVILFILSTTLLSMIPMVAITRASIANESKRRAASIARTVATLNQGAILQNSYSNLTTASAEVEDGVKQVLIVQQSDGMILAPASRAGTTPDLPFVHTARRESRPQAVEVDPLTIGASFPIGLFDPNTGEQSIKAHAVVLYDIGSLAFDDGRAISLFMQTLIIASLVGLIIFFFMYKLIEHPINTLNSQLDIALREKKDSTEVNFLFPALQALVGNVNSLLSRYVHGESDGGGSAGFVNKDGEAENLVQIVGYPCIAISKDERVLALNSGFAQVARVEAVQLQGQDLQGIPDMALQQNLKHLMQKARENSRIIHTDQLEFSGHACILSCQAMGSAAEVDYFVITISPTEGGAG